jgi:uncharacterized membrane protein
MSEYNSSKSLIMKVVIVCVILISGIILLQPKESNLTSYQIVGDEIVISDSNLDFVSNFYQYDANGVSIRFFAVKDYNENIHLALDACDLCYSEKKGYSQQDALMVCNNCQNTFLIQQIGTENIQGGCWPSYIPITLKPGNIHIKINDLLSKKYMFE